MHIDWWTLGLQTVNAVVLIWLLARFLFKPIANIMAQRQEAVRKLLEEAKRTNAAAQEQQQRIAAEANTLAQQRQQMIQTTMAEAATLKSSLEATAHADADRLRAANDTEIEKIRREAAAADADRASLFALDIATRLLERLPKEARVTGFIDGLATALQQLPDNIRTTLANSHDVLHLTSPQELSTQELETCRTALSSVLGKDFSIETHVDPAVIAGLELEMSHVVVRNSFRDDLTHLKTALLSHDTTPN